MRITVTILLLFTVLLPCSTTAQEKPVEGEKSVRKLLEDLCKEKADCNLILKKLIEIGESAVGPLIEALKDEKKEIRDYAARALGKIGDTRAIKPLIRALRTKESHIPDYTMKALTEIGEAAVAPLLEALKDLRLVNKAAEILGEIGDKRAVEPLINILEKCECSTRDDAATALGKIGDRRAVEPLIKFLKSKNISSNDDGLFRDFMFHRNVADALAMIGDKRAVEPLIQDLKDGDWRIRNQAAVALAFAEFDDERIVKPLIAALKDTNDHVRYWSVKALGSLTGKVPVEPLIEAMKDKKRDVCIAVAEALGNTGDKRAAKALIASLSDSTVRETAIIALGNLRDKAAVEPLIGILGNKDEEDVIRYHAALALGKIRDKRANELLKKLLKEGKDKFIRLGAACGLATMGADDKVLEHIIEAAGDKDWGVRWHGVRLLGIAGDKRGVEVLTAVLKNEDEVERIRQDAAWSLGETGGTEAIAPLIKALKDNDWFVRQRSAYALGKIGEKTAIEPLIAALKDKKLYVRRAAEKSLRKITKQDFGRDYDKWKEWFKKEEKNK